MAFFNIFVSSDISMLGYLYNNKIGSYIYNIGHSYIIPILITLFYLAVGVDLLLGISLIWLAHIAMDRTIGYGLKYTVGFDKTTIQKV
uniref:DUF4260 family protein n=1 Tax=Staphylococcus aureus TaxID=1280 RepID=T2K0U2_STAAU|nr:hypothetical protein [Staphylococcus aureus]